MRIIAGEWGGRTIKAPPGRKTRPTTDRIREAWMSALGGWLDGLRVLDLFAGSGALGLEALSRGAARAIFVERSRKALGALEANIDSLGAGDRSRVVRADVFSVLDRWPRADVDLALADPPYDRRYASRLLDRFHRAPFAGELWVEHRSDESLPDIPGLRHRRYGDTTITILAAPDADPGTDPDTP